MMNLLFSAQGRINRSRLWFGMLVQALGCVMVAALMAGLWQVVPGTIGGDGQFSVSGATALPYILLVFGTIAALAWSGICLGVKRFHDRGKSGAWVLIQFVPFIGAIWYFIEAGCLAGTPGPNRFGPDTLAATMPDAVAA